MTATSHAESPEPRHTWGAVLAMALAAFALVASEFMPVSLVIASVRTSNVAA
ncbi:Arabinose efflux permease [Pseudomonas chlororaphis]|nr:hypothetical protein [Pseudomonas chlororaphis]AZD08959.1 Arabinose efflux permease [Pseudomonas chlororaphis]